VKADLKKPLEYASVLAVLMLYRLIAWIGSRSVLRTKVEVSEG
jgi:hypothetical protein